MLRRTYSSKYMNAMSDKLGHIFLTKSSRNKKNDDGGKYSFGFSQIQEAVTDAINEKSIQPILESESSPIILIFSILIFIGIMYIFIAALSVIFFSSSAAIPPTSFNTASSELLIEMDGVLTKLIDIRHAGNMKDYESFLQPTMQKYCLDHLGPSFFSTVALESFHMNLAETISFVARGNKFLNHKALAVTFKGGIIDPHNSDESKYLLDTAKSCPLLEAIFASASSKTTATDKQCTSGSCSSDNNNKDTIDNKDKFDKQYSWENMQEFFELILRAISTQGTCSRIPTELNKENMKSFILNFYEMADIIGRESVEEEKDGQIIIEDYHNDPSSKQWKKYVIGIDGGIYQTNDYNNDQYIHCNPIENILNDKFELDENLSYTNVKIAIDDKYDEWYKQIQKASN